MWSPFRAVIKIIVRIAVTIRIRKSRK